ncbi:MAG: hypothetical protein M0O96_06950 [Desulforhopalus sp.]|nr:hypothetical protein [Desulforhopalus sp.]
MEPGYRQGRNGRGRGLPLFRKVPALSRDGVPLTAFLLNQRGLHVITPGGCQQLLSGGHRASPRKPVRRRSPSLKECRLLSMLPPRLTALQWEMSHRCRSPLPVTCQSFTVG